MTLVSFILDTLASAAVGGSLIALLAWLLRSWITERLSQSIKHEYARDIEAYKNAMVSAISASAEGQKAAIEARMRGFDRVWKAMLAVRKNTGPITTFLDILTVDEYKTIKNHTHFQAIVGGLDQERIMKMIPDQDIEEARPYVGEVVWALLSVYQAVSLRIVMLAWLSSDKDEEKIHWYKDTPTRNLLALALTKEELKKFDALRIGKIDYVRKAIEIKVLAAWQRVISGAEFGDEALFQAHKILEATSKVGRG